MTLQTGVDAETMRRMITTESPLTPAMIVRSTLSIAALRIDATGIGALFRETRALGDDTGIKGVIVSDGERVAHILHGAPENVEEVIRHISADQRLADLIILAQQEVDDNGTAWPLSGWKAGWATPDVLCEMRSSAAGDPKHAVASCLGLLAQCELL